jgi:hypothetical protein
MLHEQFEHQHVANTIENERFEAANIVEMAASSSKMQKASQCCKYNENERFKFNNVCKIPLKWQLPAPKCCK